VHVYDCIFGQAYPMSAASKAVNIEAFFCCWINSITLPSASSTDATQDFVGHSENVKKLNFGLEFLRLEQKYKNLALTKPQTKFNFFVSC
jgi:hypothetical protein